MARKKDEYNYFDEFIKGAEIVVESSKLLKGALEKYDLKTVEAEISKVHKLENDADKIIHDMRNYLIKDFLPPIDREDIVILGHRLDDIEDYIDEILINFNILNIESVREDAFEFVNLLIEASEAVKKALEDFKNFKKVEPIKENVLAINILEDKGDRLYEKVMKKLYSEEKNAIEIIKWTTIYDCFENAIDACENIADEMADVIMKNS